ncbi:MAG TPA: PAS domain S-box protein [Isosphaeraceae bacterium]|nr:PAS domain S-box protein [Isosphaeraceae bacterium]
MSTEGPHDAGRQDGEFFRLLIDGVRDYAIFVIDPDGWVATWNAGAGRILGYAEGEIVGHEFARLFTPEDAARGEPGREMAEARAEGISEDERWHVRKDGSRFWASGVLRPLRDEAGALRGYVKVLRENTERKRLMEELAASEARFRMITEQAPILIWRSDARGRHDYFNRPWYDFRGRGPAQELGLGWTEGIHPEDRTRYFEAYGAAVARRERFECSFRLRRHDGQYRWVADRATPYYDASGRSLGYLGSCLDITERIELEAALQQQRELAEEASRHKTRLMSALSHDARTPLNAVVLAAQLLESHLEGSTDPEIVESLRTIRHSVRNVLDLLGDLLNLTRIDAGATPAEASRFDLGVVLAECFSSVEAMARPKGLGARLEPGELAGLVVETDRAKLKQILSNLLSNAVRYTERGHIGVRGERAADQVRVAVEDTGVGIDPRDQQRIFDEFARLDNPHRPMGEGTGLGLALCRRLANLLQGEITVQSEPGRGSTFTLALPATIVASDAPRDEPPDGTDAPHVAGTVVVAEDHLASRQTLAMVLRRMGYRVLEASNGRDALALVRQERPLAILMDVNMPVMDGIEATLAIRTDPLLHHVPIFALTGDVSVINRRRIGEAGISGYLEKPVTWDVLKKALADLPSPPPR